MSLIDDIKRDREAGTPGPWFARETYVHDKHVWFDADGSRHGETPNIAFNCDTEENASRIARVPDMEAALLAADALASAVGDWSRPTGANGMTSPSDNHPLMVALYAYREATK